MLGAGCLPYYSNLALWPFMRMFDRLVSHSGENPDRQQLLVGHLTSLGMDPVLSVPFLGPLIGITGSPEYPAPELDPIAVLDETLTQLVEWLAALAAQTPLMLVVEDLHWADPSTLALMGRLAQRCPRGLLTLATARSSSPIGWADEARVVRLDGLGEAAAAGLIDALTPGGPLDPEVRAAIVERSEGIPLFIEELTRSLVESRREPLPMRLQELLTWRLKSPLVDLRVAQTAATVGPIFDADVVSAVMGDAATVAGQLVVLAKAGVIERVDPRGSTYRFSHALMRDAAYETQVLEVRAQTHALIAQELLGRGAQPALVGEHLDRAGDAEAAALQYVIGARTEQTRGAHPEAVRLLTRALELLETVPQGGARDLSELTGRALRAYSAMSMQGYAAPTAGSDFRRAEELTRSLGDRPVVLPSLFAITGFLFTRGDLSTSRPIVERMIRMVGQPPYAMFEAEVAGVAAQQALLEGRIGHAHSHQQHALDLLLARPPDQAVSPFWPLPHDPIAVSAVTMALISAFRGDWQQIEPWEQRALARAQEIGFPNGPWSLAFVKGFGAMIRRFRGQDEEARFLGTQIAAIAREHGWPFTMHRGLMLAAGSDPQRPDRVALQQMIETLNANGQGAFQPANIAVLASLCERDGDLDQAIDQLNRALGVVAETGERLHLPEILRQRASYVLARNGPVPEVVADLARANSVAREQGSLVAWLRAAVAIGRLPEAIRPEDWRAILGAARSAVPASLASDDTAAADDLLA